MIAEKTGWTKNEIIYNNSFASLNMMLADAPKLSNKKKHTQKEFESDADLEAWLMK